MWSGDQTGCESLKAPLDTGLDGKPTWTIFRIRS
jgi:hypothetical protein